MVRYRIRVVKAEIRRQKGCLLVCRKCCVCGPAAQIHHLVQPALAYLDTVRIQLHHDSEDSNLKPKGMRRFVGSAPLIFLCWKTSSKQIAKKGYFKLPAVDDIWIRDLCAGPSAEQCKFWPRAIQARYIFTVSQSQSGYGLLSGARN